MINKKAADFAHITARLSDGVDAPKKRRCALSADHVVFNLVDNPFARGVRRAAYIDAGHRCKASVELHGNSKSLGLAVVGKQNPACPAARLYVVHGR